MSMAVIIPRIFRLSLDIELIIIKLSILGSKKIN